LRRIFFAKRGIEKNYKLKKQVQIIGLFSIFTSP